MSDVVNRTTGQYRKSVNTPDYDTADWLINPDLSAVLGIPQQYWKVEGDSVVEMNQAEKDAVDVAMAPQPTVRGIQDYVNLGGKVTSASFERIGSYLYRGSAQVGEPHAVELIARIDPGAVGEVRVYDQENGIVIASAQFNSSVDERIELQISESWPTEPTILEIQIRRISGSANKHVYCYGMVIAY